MASVGDDQFWADFFNPTATSPAKRKLLQYSNTSSMSAPQSSSVVKTDPANMQGAAQRRLKKMQQQQDQNNVNS